MDGMAHEPVHETESPYEWLGQEWLPETWEPVEPIGATRAVDRIRRSTAGAMLAGGMIAIRDILEGERNDPPAIVQQAGEPPSPRRFDVELDPDDPGNSTVTIRH
jgi:hypothetical protein